MAQTSTEIVVAGVEGEGRGNPKAGEADQGRIRKKLIAGRAGDQEGDGDQLETRLQLGKLGNGHGHAKLGEKFTQARYQNLAADNDNTGPGVHAVNGLVAGE